MTEIYTSTAAQMLNISPNTMRAWDNRYGLANDHTKGAWRLFDREMVLGLHDAMDAGLRGRVAVDRARELAASGIYREDPDLRERLSRIEAELTLITSALWALTTETRGDR